MVVLGKQGLIESCSAKADKWLAFYFPTHRQLSAVPVPVAKWLAAHAGAATNGGKNGAGGFVVERESRRLRIVPDTDASGRRLLLVTEEELTFSTAVLQSIGFTAREAEVMRWVAEGKTNPEIAIILGIKSRTVTTHVKNIFSKLQVNNRATALLCVMEKLRGV